MVSYDTECVFAIVRILKGTIPLQILIFLYFFFDLLIFVRSSYTAFRWEPLDAARWAGRLAGMRKESPARSRLPPDYAATPVCLPSCSPLSLKLCGETGELVAVFPEAVSCLTETRFLILGTLASLTVMACFPEREMLRRSFNFVEDRLRWISTSTKMIASVDGDFNMW